MKKMYSTLIPIILTGIIAGCSSYSINPYNSQKDREKSIRHALNTFFPPQEQSLQSMENAWSAMLPPPEEGRQSTKNALSAIFPPLPKNTKRTQE
ncbi:hypothetical protein CMI41_03730 [Candidatus Pacearchaeota archaeon]|nr:hypothetical protein [Candidatus Pacearchaeota archaeon]|tara:strand:- start:1977 stop:2261 length:285 start_codon:yes stop_codon:yes gene_type:complete